MNDAIGKNTTDISTLNGKVSALEAINHDAYVAADTALETKITTAYGNADTATLNSAKSYSDEKVNDLKEIVDDNTAAISTNADAIAELRGL